MANLKDFTNINITDEPSQFICTILNGQSISTPINVGRATPCGIVVDEVLSGLTLYVSANIRGGNNWYPFYDGEAVPARYSIVLPAVPVSQKAYIPLSPVIFTGIQNIRFELSIGAVSADTSIEVALRPF